MKRIFNVCIILLVTMMLAGFVSCGNLSNPTETKTETGLAVPTGLKATESQTDYRQVQLTWSEVEGAYGYNVFMAKNSDFSDSGSETPEEIVSTTSASIQVSTGTNYFRVQAYKVGNEGKWIYSEFSSVVEYTCIEPDSNTPPKHVSAVQSKEYGNKVLLTWQDNGSLRYNVYYSTTNDSTTAQKYGRDSSEHQLLIHLTESNTYYFWVKAADVGNNEGDFSEVATCKFTSSTITAPQNLSATREPGKNIINLTWKESGAYRYRIYYNTEDNREGAKDVESNIFSKTFIDSNSYSFKAKEDGHYYFWVVAENADKSEIGWSESASYNFTVIKPKTPTNLSVEVSGGMIFISHTKIEGMDYTYYYNTERNTATAKTAFSVYNFYFNKSGTWYFWVTARDSSGVESDFSYPTEAEVTPY